MVFTPRFNEMKGKFYFSQQKKDMYAALPPVQTVPFRHGNSLSVYLPAKRTFCKLEDGRIVEYTELIEDEKTSVYPDAVFLGYGEFSHTE